MNCFHNRGIGKITESELQDTGNERLVKTNDIGGLCELQAQLEDIAKHEIDLQKYKKEFVYNPTEKMMDITDALQHALDDSCPWNRGYVWGNQGKTVKIPEGQFLITKTLFPRSGFSLKGSGLGTRLISKVPDNAKTFDVSSIANWEMSDLLIQGNNYLNYGIWSDPTNPDTTATIRYKLTNVYTRKFLEGISLAGFIGSIINVRANENKIGCRLTFANAVGIVACAFEANTDTGLIIESGHSIHLSSGTVIEGNSNFDCVVNGGDHITFDNVYFENGSSDVIQYSLKIGNEENRVFNVTLSNCFFGGGSAVYGAALFDKVTNLSLISVTSYHDFKGFTFSENCMNVKYEDVYVTKSHIYDDGNAIRTRTPENLIPNSEFNNWVNDSLPSSWLPMYSNHDGRASAVITKENDLIRNGQSSMRLTCKDGVSGSAVGFYLPKDVVKRIKNKNVTVGCWVFIPDIEDFGDYIKIKAGPNILMVGTGVSNVSIEKITSGSKNNYYKKGKWNFIQKTFFVDSSALAETAGGVRLDIYVSNGPEVVSSTKYVVIDSVILCEGLYTSSTLVQMSSRYSGTNFTEDLKVSNHSYNLNRLILGNNYIWVDRTGKLRIKNGEPTSDTDGAIV